MSFRYPKGKTGITVGGADLAEFSCKLLSGARFGACSVEVETFQGKDRSTMLLLDQRFGALEMVLPLEFWGCSRADTAANWSAFCAKLRGKAEVDLGDGFLYACVAADFGTPVWITDTWLTADVTLRGMRQKREVTISAETVLDVEVFCESTFPRTDCVITLPGTVLGEAKQVSVMLGENQWFLRRDFTGAETLVLDGQEKKFLLSGVNVTGEMEWEDFPYLVPGRNFIGVYVDGVGVRQGFEISYRPTFL